MNNGGKPDSDRAQILAVTAVIVAIAFIGLVGAAYTGASTADERAEGPGAYTTESKEAIHTAVYAMEDTLLDVNADQSLTTRSTRETAAREGVKAAANALDANGQFSGRLVEVELAQYGGTETPAGTRVVQNNESNLTDASGNADWTVVAGADQTRQAAIEVDPYQLASSEGGGTQVTLVGNTTESVTIYRNGTSVALSHSGGECRVGEIGPTTDEPFATLRLTTGTLTLTNGDTTLGGGCTGYEAPDTIERIEITNGDATAGTLSVVSLGNDVEGANVNTASAPPAAGDADAPTAHHVVYGVPVEVTVATERTTTSRLVIVAPGNRPNPLPSP